MDVTHTSVWTSSNPALASVDKNTGVVIGHKAGKVTITDSDYITGTKNPVISTHDIEITDQRIIGIELQETYTKNGDGKVLSEQSKTIPVLWPITTPVFLSTLASAGFDEVHTEVWVTSIANRLSLPGALYKSEELS
jgi:hypothetical protein